MRQTLHTLLAVATVGALTLTLAACGPDDGQQGADPTDPATTGAAPTGGEPSTEPTDEPTSTFSAPPRTATPIPKPTNEQPSPSTTVPGDQAESQQAKDAVSDLTQAEGAQASDVTVLRDEAVTWPDGAMGCPQPGMVYTQALVEGHYVQLELDGKTYHYTGGQQGKLKRCDKPQVPQGPDGQLGSTGLPTSDE